MTPEELLNAIEGAASLREFVEANLLSRTPWIFQGNVTLFHNWRQAAARAAGINDDDIYLVGSAATGYSLSPLKLGKVFRHAKPGERYPSDLDIAIVNPGLFVTAWNILLRFDRVGSLRKLIRETQNFSLEELHTDIQQMRWNVYWGAISDQHVVSNTNVARVLRSLFSATTRTQPFIGHGPKARIYRRREDLVGYHEQSLQQTKEALYKRRRA